MPQSLQIRLPVRPGALSFLRGSAHLLPARHPLVPAGVGIKADMAHGVLSRLRYVPQDLLHESFHCHTPQLWSSIPMVMVAELDPAIPHAGDPGVADRTTPYVAGQVGRDPPAMRVAPLQPDIPFLPGGGPEPVVHLRHIATRRLHPPTVEIIAQPGEQLAPENTLDHGGRQQEVALQRPPLSTACQSTAADQAVDMRVGVECPPPGVQGHHDPRCGTEVALLLQELKQRVTAGVKQC